MASFIDDFTQKLPPLPPDEPPPLSTYAPKPKLEHRLGTLQNVRQLTSTSADEIEKAADQLVSAAHETAEVLRDVAHRLRESGFFANERLANFVKLANTCAKAAKFMQRSVSLRDEKVIESESER